MKVEAILVLPNGQEYKFWCWWANPEKVWTYDDFNRETKYWRDLFSNNDSVNVTVLNSRGEKETLILWGNVLKNTYIRARLIE